MRYLLDTNACIMLLAGQPNLLARARQCEEGELVMSAIGFAELALGSWHGKPPQPDVLARLRTHVPVLPFDEAAARRYAVLPFKRGSYDRLIAAHALALELTLVTNNVGDFAGVSELRIEDWTIQDEIRP